MVNLKRKTKESFKIWSLQFLILGFAFLSREYLTP